MDLHRLALHRSLNFSVMAFLILASLTPAIAFHKFSAVEDRSRTITSVEQQDYLSRPFIEAGSEQNILFMA